MIVSKFNDVLFFIVTSIFIIADSFLLDNTLSTTKFIELQLVLVWSVAFYKSYKKFGIFNIFTLLMVTTFLFGVGAIFHFLFSSDDIRILDRGFGHFTFSYYTIQVAICAFTVFVLLSYLTYSHFYKKSAETEPTDFPDTNQFYLDLGRLLMKVFLVIVLYKGYLFFNAFNGNRVLIYLGGTIDTPIPTWVRFFSTFFEVGYYFVLASKPPRKVFNTYSLLYMAELIPGILIGNRGSFGAFICVFFWYTWKTYHKLILPQKYIILLGIAMLFIFQLMEFIRDGFVAEDGFSITRFLVGQGVSFYILPLYIDYAHNIQYYLYPFILYGILAGFSGYTGQSIECLQHKCGVGHQLMYAVNPEYYLMGASFGSSCVTELYDLGKVGFVLGSIFFGYMVFWVDKKIDTKIFWRFAAFFILSNLLLAPRGMFFPSFYFLVKYYIFFRASSMLYKLVYKKKTVK